MSSFLIVPQKLSMGALSRQLPFLLIEGFIPSLSEELSEMGTAILASPIRVMNKALGRTFRRRCPDKRLLDKLLGDS